MKQQPGIPFWAESVTTAAAMEIDTPSGSDTVHIFEALPRYDEPIDGQPNKLKRTTVADTPEQRVRVKHGFKNDAMPIGDYIYVMPSVDGLCEILIWECDE